MTRDQIMGGLMLMAAIEECERTGLRLEVDTSYGFSVTVRDENDDQPRIHRHATTLSAAITAILADIGVPVPEWPSEEVVEWEGFGRWGATLTLYGLRDVFVREPLTAIALLMESDAA